MIFFTYFSDISYFSKVIKSKTIISLRYNLYTIASSVSSHFLRYHFKIALSDFLDKLVYSAFAILVFLLKINFYFLSYLTISTSY